MKIYIKQLIRKYFNNSVTREDILPRHKTQKAQSQIWLQNNETFKKKKKSFMLQKEIN